MLRSEEIENALKALQAPACGRLYTKEEAQEAGRLERQLAAAREAEKLLREIDEQASMAVQNARASRRQQQAVKFSGLFGRKRPR